MHNHTKLTSIEDVEQGDHLCSIYKNINEQFALLVPYFKQGLENNEKCIYVVDENTDLNVQSEFKKRGLNLDKAIKAGQFVLLTKRETYLRDGYFDPMKMIKLLKETEEQSLNEGYAGMRITGEMTWILGKIKDVAKLILYEAWLNNYFSGSHSSSICQYNENKFTTKILTGVMHTHPLLILYGKLKKNLYHFSPAKYTREEDVSALVDSYEEIKDELLTTNGV
jgi:hypothetical protein